MSEDLGAQMSTPEAAAPPNGVSLDPSDEQSSEVPDESGALSKAEPPQVNLTRLQPVAVTSVWPTEPHHLTPWLLQSGDLLSEVLGLDLELESREYKVGKFSLDIIGREVATGTSVIIENQYGWTDHLHLVRS